MIDAKKLFRSGLLTLTLLSAAMPVAFAATDTATTETEAAPQQSEGFNLSWLGLLGLLGLRCSDNRR